MEKNILEPKLDIKTINEILQDTFYFKILLEFKKKLKNVEAKRYLTMFMKYLAITFAYELSICMERCKILDKDAFFKTNMKKRVRDERNWLHQDIANSRKMNNKILQMGINFNELIYDLNIIVKDEKLLDLNFEDFNKVQELLKRQGTKVDENGNADLLYGYLICNECGATLRKSQKYYYCNTYSRTRKCSKHSTNRVKLIDYVIKDINKKVEKYKNLTELNRDIMFEIIDSIKICEDERIIVKYKK